MALSDEEKARLLLEIDNATERLEADDRRYTPHLPNGVVRIDCLEICKILKRHGLCENETERPAV